MLIAYLNLTVVLIVLRMRMNSYTPPVILVRVIFAYVYLIHVSYIIHAQNLLKPDKIFCSIYLFAVVTAIASSLDRIFLVFVKF